MDNMSVEMDEFAIKKKPSVICKTTDGFRKLNFYRITEFIRSWRWSECL